MSDLYGKPRGFLEDYSGLAAAGSAFQGFAEGLQKVEDQKYKRMEFDAKMKADREKSARDAEELAIKKKKESPEEIKREEDLRLNLSGQEAVRDADGNFVSSKYRPDYLEAVKARADASAGADPLGTKALAAEKARQEAAQARKGVKLQPDKVLLIQEGADIPTTLKDIELTLENNKDSFGPIEGRKNSMNPYNEKAQTIDGQMMTAAQSFGRYMEGGVLRKEDEAKYRKMFPSLSDTPAVAQNKLKIVQKKLVDKHNGNINALRAQGYDTTGFDLMESNELPEILGHNKGKGYINPGVIKEGILKAPPAVPAPMDAAAREKRIKELEAKAARE